MPSNGRDSEIGFLEQHRFQVQRTMECWSEQYRRIAVKRSMVARSAEPENPSSKLHELKPNGH